MLVSFCLEIVLILMQDWCTICAKRTAGSESFWTHLVELLGDMDHVESHFGPFGDSVNVSARLVQGLRQMYHRSTIVLDAPDGTPS
jgi:hypothetical protein